MKKVFAILFASLTLTASIHVSAKDKTHINASKYNSDEREVANFSSVAGAGPINIIITLGSKAGCRLEGDAEAIASIVTEVKGNALIIRPQTSITSWSRKYEDKKITAYVTATSLKSVTMNGSGGMTVNGKVNAGDFAAVLSGSGSIKVNVDADNFSGVISGSGSINITGGADHAKVVISSSGTFAGKAFSVKTLSTTISGSGAVNIAVDESISAVISGSGSVNYSGDPSISKTVIGSGRVRKV